MRPHRQNTPVFIALPSLVLGGYTLLLAIRFALEGGEGIGWGIGFGFMGLMVLLPALIVAGIEHQRHLAGLAASVDHDPARLAALTRTRLEHLARVLPKGIGAALLGLVAGALLDLWLLTSLGLLVAGLGAGLWGVTVLRLAFGRRAADRHRYL